jgi:hypothetical protein
MRDERCFGLKLLDSLAPEAGWEKLHPSVLGNVKVVK